METDRRVHMERLAYLEERQAGLMEKLLAGGIPPCQRAFTLEQLETVLEEQDNWAALE